MSITATIRQTELNGTIAQQVVEATFNGSVNIDVDTLALATSAGETMVGTAEGPLDQQLSGVQTLRGITTAAALETLAAAHPVLKGYAGATHTLDTAPYVVRDGLVIDGNGATLLNANATSLADDDNVQTTLPLGVSSYVPDNNLTGYAIASAAGDVLTVAAGVGDNFAPGDKVWLHGTDTFYVSGDGHDIWRFHLRCVVIAATSTTITLDRVPSDELMADTPVIANTAEGVAAWIGGPDVYFLHNPKVRDLTLKSNVGKALHPRGVIDGALRDLTLAGRTGMGCNGCQELLVENIKIKAWRKLSEIAWGSQGVVMRNVHGTLEDSSTKFGGASDGGVFFGGIHENSADCVQEGYNVSSGPNDAGGTANGWQLGAGLRNEVRNGVFRFPAHTGPAMAIQGNATAGNGPTDCGYDTGKTISPVCSTLLKIADSGAGVTRPFVRNWKYFGTPSTGHAVMLGNTGGNIQGGELANLWFEHGDFYFNGGTIAGMTIRNLYIPGGFNNLTDALFKANAIFDNESDASIAANGAAVIDKTHGADISSTTANNAIWTAAFPAGSLPIGTRIWIYSPLEAAGTGTGNRIVAVGASTPTAGRQACGSNTVTANGSQEVESVLTILSDTTLSYDTTIGGVRKPVSPVTVDSLAANALTVTVEGWVTASALIGRYGCRIIPVIPGMRHFPLR